MKAKNTQYTRTQKLGPLRPVLIAAGATFTSLLLRAYTNRLELYYPSVIYLLGIVNFDLLALIAIGVNVIVMAFYIRAIAHAEQGSFAKLGLTALLFFASIGSFGHAIAHKDSLRVDQTVYHLVAEKDSVDSTSEFTSYIVLECDSTGVSCQFYAKPLTTYSHCFPQNATLDLEPTKTYLMLSWERYNEETMNITFSARARLPAAECYMW